MILKLKKSLLGEQLNIPWVYAKNEVGNVMKLLWYHNQEKFVLGNLVNENLIQEVNCFFNFYSILEYNRLTTLR